MYYYNSYNYSTSNTFYIVLDVTRLNLLISFHAIFIWPQSEKDCEMRNYI